MHIANKTTFLYKEYQGWRHASIRKKRRGTRVTSTNVYHLLYSLSSECFIRVYRSANALFMIMKGRI